jgi:hypothetical protein
MEILIDFDGTCVTHDFPLIGKDIGAVDVLQDLVFSGHKLILFTMRSDINNRNYLKAAVNWFKENNIPLYGIQENPTQRAWTNSPKAYGQLIIDDTCLGIPLKIDITLSTRPFVDWKKCRILMEELGIL